MSNNNSNIIKVAIFSGYGSCSLPYWIIEQLPTPIYGVGSRIKLAQIIQGLEPTCKSDNAGIQKAWDEFAKSTSVECNPYFKSEGENEVYLKVKDDNSLLPFNVEVSIVEVDISKPWRIRDYDGAEGIEVFGGLKVIDSEYSVCEW